MNFNYTALKQAGYIFEDPIIFSTPRVKADLVLDDRMQSMWPGFPSAMRWIILDHARRLAEYLVNNADNTESQHRKQSRIRIPSGYGLVYSGGNGSIWIKPIGNKEAGSKQALSLSFVPQSLADFSCWPAGLEPFTDLEKQTFAPEDLIKAPVFAHTNFLRRPPEKYDIDPVAERLLARIPRKILRPLLNLINANDLMVYLTNASGNSGEGGKSKGFGVRAMRRKGGCHIVPIGEASTKMYYQNGWFMMKTMDLPSSFAATVQKGLMFSDFIDVKADDGDGKTIDLFENLVITQKRAGYTNTMGPYVQVRLGIDPN